MELWIRSQDKRTLVNTRRIDVDDNKIIIWDEGKYASDVFMGEYATKERALEILDEIEKVIQINAGFELYSNLGNFANEFNEKHNFVPVFQMPKD